jgi:hypothetical protein
MHNTIKGILTTFGLFVLFQWRTYKKLKTVCPNTKSSFTFGERQLGLLATFYPFFEGGGVRVKASPCTVLPVSKMVKTCPKIIILLHKFKSMKNAVVTKKLIYNKNIFNLSALRYSTQFFLLSLLLHFQGPNPIYAVVK